MKDNMIQTGIFQTKTKILHERTPQLRYIYMESMHIVLFTTLTKTKKSKGKTNVHQIKGKAQ